MGWSSAPVFGSPPYLPANTTLHHYLEQLDQSVGSLNFFGDDGSEGEDEGFGGETKGDEDAESDSSSNEEEPASMQSWGYLTSSGEDDSDYEWGSLPEFHQEITENPEVRQMAAFRAMDAVTGRLGAPYGLELCDLPSGSWDIDSGTQGVFPCGGMAVAIDQGERVWGELGLNGTFAMDGDPPGEFKGFVFDGNGNLIGDHAISLPSPLPQEPPQQVSATPARYSYEEHLDGSDTESIPSSPPTIINTIDTSSPTNGGNFLSTTSAHPPQPQDHHLSSPVSFQLDLNPFMSSPPCKRREFLAINPPEHAPVPTMQHQHTHMHQHSYHNPQSRNAQGYQCQHHLPSIDLEQASESVTHIDRQYATHATHCAPNTQEIVPGEVVLVTAAPSPQVRRGGRPVPPPEADTRWNIWTVGNLQIRSSASGVGVKHLKEVLYRDDGRRGCKRSKWTHERLVAEIMLRREQQEISGLFVGRPQDFAPHQGWWGYFDIS